MIPYSSIIFMLLVRDVLLWDKRRSYRFGIPIPDLGSYVFSITNSMGVSLGPAEHDSKNKGISDHAVLNNIVKQKI